MNTNMIQTLQIPSNNDCLLTYSFDTYPTPLQISPEGDKRQHGIITVTVSNTAAISVYCEQIKLTLPVGEGPSHFTETPETISAFMYTNDATKVWEVQNDQAGILTATPQAGNAREITNNDSLVFYIYYIQVNKKLGTFPITVAERTATTDASFTQKAYVQNFSKFPHGFFLKDLAAYKKEQQGDKEVLTPIAELDNSSNGERIILAWHGASNATYTLFYPEQPAGIPIPEGEKSWTSPGPIRDTTTFLLQATTRQGEEQVKAYLSTTVVVNQPAIQAKSLEAGNATLKSGELKIGNNTLKSQGSVINASSNLNTQGKIQENGHDLMPQGSIIMWSGHGANIPGGWALCDGNDDRPDLTNRFILGAGSTQEAHLKGGHDEIQLEKKHIPSHTHEAVVQEGGKHKHNVNLKVRTSELQHSGSAPKLFPPNGKHGGQNSSTTYNYSTSETGAHDHNIDIQPAGSGEPISYLPRYYALCFIYKL